MKAKLKAFTLIELLIVVAIIAILAAIAVPNFLEARIRSQVSRVKSDQRTYATALESYYVDYNTYPCTLDSYLFPERCVNPFGNGLILEAWMYGLSSPVSYLSSGILPEPFNARQGGALFAGCDIADIVTPPSPIGGPCDDRSDRIPVYGYLSLPNDDLVAFFMPAVMNLIAAELPSLVVTQQMTEGVIRKRWGLISPGPDSFFSYDRCMADPSPDSTACLFEQVADAFIDEVNGIYDPTNGSVSRGEVVRTVAGVE